MAAVVFMSDNADKLERKTRYDLQEMLLEISQQPAPESETGGKVSQSDISALFKKKRKAEKRDG